MHKVVSMYGKEDKDLRTDLEEMFGRFNDFPPGWAKMPDGQISQHLSVVPKYIEFRQMYKKPNREITQALLYHFDHGNGYAVVQKYLGISQGHTHEFYTFDCLEKLRDIFNNLVDKDNGWKLDKQTSRPHRGIENYNRGIRFIKNLTDKELNRVVSYLTRDKCPGWTGVIPRKLGEFYYSFRTTYDCSD